MPDNYKQLTHTAEEIDKAVDLANANATEVYALKNYAMQVIQTELNDLEKNKADAETVEELKEDIEKLNNEAEDIYKKSEVDEKLNDKVEKIEGKGLSANDFSDEYKNKINKNAEDLENTYSKSEVDKKIGDKVDKIEGKGLSTNDFDNKYKSKVDDTYTKSEVDLIVSPINEKATKNDAGIEQLKSDLAETNRTVENNKSNLQGQIDALVLEAGGDSNPEVVQARVDADGVSHETLKARLDAEKETVEKELNFREVSLNNFGFDMIDIYSLPDVVVHKNKSLRGYDTTSFTPNIGNQTDATVVDFKCSDLELLGITKIKMSGLSPDANKIIKYTAGIKAENVSYTSDPPETLEYDNAFFDGYERAIISLPNTEFSVKVVQDMNNVSQPKTIKHWIDESDIKTKALNIDNLHRYMFNQTRPRENDGSRLLHFGLTFAEDTPVRVTLSEGYEYKNIRCLDNQWANLRLKTIGSGDNYVDITIPAGSTMMQLHLADSTITDSITFKLEEQNNIASAVEYLIKKTNNIDGENIKDNSVSASKLKKSELNVDDLHNYIINKDCELQADGTRLLHFSSKFTAITPATVILQEDYNYTQIRFMQEWNGLKTYKLKSGQKVVDVEIPVNTNRMQVWTVEETTDTINIKIEAQNGLANVVESNKQKIKQIENNMTSNIITSVSMFSTFGCIGDSYTHGDTVNVNGDWVQCKCPWPETLAKRNGNTAYNYGQGGKSTHDYDVTGVLLAEAHDMYFYALGINDSEKKYSDEDSTPLDHLGTIEDIHEDYTTNPDTFYGNYGKIIAQIMEHAPKARHCMILIPLTGGYKDSFNTAITEIANHFGIPYINPFDDTFFYSQVYNLMSEGHPTCAGYVGMSFAYERLFGNCVEENANYFLYANLE